MKKKSVKKKVVRKRANFDELFNEKKYRSSLKKSGLSNQNCDEIYDEVCHKLDRYFTTAELHSKTYKAILKRSRVIAANYDIKRAIYNLGPTGYPFEILCAQMLMAKGYETKVSVIKKGKFVKHEVDIIAKRKDKNLYCECKFHNRKGYKDDIKVPLYVNSRFVDIKEANPKEHFEYALFSNTSFTQDAVKYAEGEGLLLYSMNYPKKNTFIDLIRKYKVYPITALKSLKVSVRKNLLEEGIVVVKQMRKEVLEKYNLKESEISKVMQEVKILTRPN